ncbi:methionine--tRNA ligase, cytoplasmic [Lutzomyia longipalpis]|uniref:Methionine--tRNA ligase, cytoplasmic n=1 Tax=Lutzomyia longipalpis TaxID=7200 RepID=A0A7G3AS09_LUTLO|nr:methionine--tRNA ligase, cytoplasmic [Lutzomyia longipalpis]
MKIVTNPGNPHGLAFLLAAKFGKKAVKIEKLEIDDSQLQPPKHLPYLLLPSGQKIFGKEAGIRYLLADSAEVSVKAEELTEWLLTDFIPILTTVMTSGSRRETTTAMKFKEFAKKLDDILKNEEYLSGKHPSTPDFILWSILSTGTATKEVSGFENLCKWHEKISNSPEAKEALSSYNDDLTFTSLQNANKFGSSISSSAPQAPVADESPTADAISAEEIAAAIEGFIFQDIPQKKDVRTVLPRKGERNILITSALPYVNNVPHLGNIIGCVLSADIFARYCRLSGYNTLYICGTDEYGTATETKAIAEKMTPQEICDKYFEIHNSIYRWFGIGFDFFGRTTTLEQTQIVQNMFHELYDAGYVSTESVAQLLCQKCQRYLADRFVEGTCPHVGCGYEDARGDQCDSCGKLVNATELIKPRCKLCNATPVLRDSSQFFINLPKIEPKLREWFGTVEKGWTHNARVITKSWLREGLRPRCITRDLKWGIPVPKPGFESKVFYVWFDAPIGYMSITSKYTREWKQWWQPQADVNVSLYQFMAKDNVPFHSVMFPATLLAINKGYTTVSHIMATEYLNYEDGKFSKSRGLGVFGNDAQDTGIPADVWRFYLACARPEGQDSSFSWNDLEARNNSELLNNLGNFINRALMFCEKNFGGVVPQIVLQHEDHVLLAQANREYREYVACMEKAKMRDAIKHILNVSRHGNQFMQSTQPWVLIKGTDDQKSRAGTVIGLCANITVLLATLIFPFMPDTARKIYKQANVNGGFINPSDLTIKMMLKPGHKIGKPEPLFAKIDPARIEELKLKYGGQQFGNEKPEKLQKAADPQPSNLSIGDLEKAIAEQGEKVRQLKASAEKAVWQPEVEKLLALKKQLAVSTGQPENDSAKNKKKKK